MIISNYYEFKENKTNYYIVAQPFNIDWGQFPLRFKIYIKCESKEEAIKLYDEFKKDKLSVVKIINKGE